MQNSFIGGDIFTFLSNGGAVGGSGLNYGSFYDTITQIAAIDTPTPMKLNTTDFVNGFSIENDLLGNPTRIKADRTGKYNLQFSAQLERTLGGNTRQVDIWIRINDIDVPFTNTSVNVQANAGRLVAAWNFFISLNANQYVQIMWAQNDTIYIAYDIANLTIPYPATPSVIATIVEV